MQKIGGIEISLLGQNLQNKKLLDYGAGNGDYSVFFLKKGLHVTAVDINPESEKLINSKLSQEEKNSFNFFCLNADSDFLNIQQKFDYIICREVLEHIKNYEKVIKEFKELLNPDGVLVLSVPTSFTEKYFYFWDSGWLKKCGHINIFRKKDILALAKNNQFELVKVGKHSFRRTIFWSLVVPFKIKHDMGKVLSHHKLARVASFISDVICYFKFVENLGDKILPKSNVFYFKKSV